MDYQTNQHTLMKGDRKGRSDIMNSDSQETLFGLQSQDSFLRERHRVPSHQWGGHRVILKHSLKLPIGGRI